MIITLAGHSCSNQDPNYLTALNNFLATRQPMKSVPDYDTYAFKSACIALCQYYQVYLNHHGLLGNGSTVNLQFNGYREDLNGIVDWVNRQFNPSQVSDLYVIHNPDSPEPTITEYK